MLNIHATLISLDNQGVLLIGESGSGKSDVALRMIMEKGAKLVADDRVNLENNNNRLVGRAPKEIEGLLEVRNVGISHFPFKSEVNIALCVELCVQRDMLERLPYDEHVDFLGVSITKLKLYPFDCSILCKIIVKLNEIKKNNKLDF